MAKIKQGILGGFSGKVASLVGTSWKGRAVMKSLPLSVSNPRTESQVGQRNKFSKVAELASAILTQFVQPVENPISGNISGYNLFCKDNKTAFNAAGDFVPANLVCGGGKIINLEDFELAAHVGDPDVLIAWENAEEISALRLTDKVYAAAIDENGEVIATTSGTVARSAEQCHMELLAGKEVPVAGKPLTIIYACVSADGRDVSVKTNAFTDNVGA